MNTTRHLAWYAFQFDIPLDWEITGHAIDEREGRLEFSTRDGFQAAVHWEPCKAYSPESAMQAFLQKHVPAARDTPVTRLLVTRDAGAFRLGIPAGAGQPCQAVHHLAASRKLLRWVFADASPEAVERHWRPLLASFEGNQGPVRRFAAFGLDVRVPSEYDLEDLTVYPANVMMAFESKRKARLRLHRWGLPELVLGGRTLSAFYAGFLGAQKAQPAEPRTTTFRGCPAVTVAYEQRPEHQMDAMMGRHWKNGVAWLWHDQAEQRLYACEQIGPEGVEPLPLDAMFGAAPTEARA